MAHSKKDDPDNYGWTCGYRIPSNKFWEIVREMDKVVKKYAKEEKYLEDMQDFNLVIGLYSSKYMNEFKIKEDLLVEKQPTLDKKAK